ncbi:MAG: ExeM/NucH family extracellular endonuclease [Candidatus Tectimicrobiota bacterium]
MERQRSLWSTALWLVALACAGPVQQAAALSPDVVISQVYGGGGNSGATYRNDFIELFNRGTSAVSLTGWSVQYASSGGTTWQKTDLSGTLQPGQYYLIQEAQGAGGSINVPTPNAIGSIAMSATAGKVALVNSTAVLSGSCPLASSVDFVGYGTATNCSEGSPTANLSNTTAALRQGGGATETDNNSADFTIGAPNPRNSVIDAAPQVASIVPADGASNVALDSLITLTFNEPVAVSGAWWSLVCSGSGVHEATVSGGPTLWTLDPSVPFVDGDLCTLTVFALQVTDLDSQDPPDTLAANFTASFSTGEACLAPYTPIYSIQGSGVSAALTGPVTTQGVVIGLYEGPAPALGGFYIQDPAGDGDDATSDAIFVFTNSTINAISLGDVVRVSGRATEFQEQTELTNVSAVVVCGTDTVTPVDVALPFPSADYAERYEGMLVHLPQTLSVTEHFQLGRFGQVVLSAEGRLLQPTSVAAPGAAANALQAANDLNRIILDDDQNDQNPDPILFGRAGNPLSAGNTLRLGDTASGIVGVMTYTWAGNAASGNAYRVRPYGALGGQATFVAANPRPASVPAVGGTLTVVGMNMLNFFNTFANCTGGIDGEPIDCRGAESQEEFARQWPKTIAAILAMHPDILGVNEIENDGYGPGSALHFLVAQLNAATAPGTYALIDADARTGQMNVLGTDAIKVGLLYKPGVVTPIGQTAVLNTEAFVNGGDSAPRSRPSLAQAFEQRSTRARLIVNVNHLKSKGSACDEPDAGDGQGNCNAVRQRAAMELVSWLASDPTGTREPNILLVGDYNSYAREDPIAVLEGAGFTNLIASFLGQEAYSYVFDGQSGYLDHALASAYLVSQITGVGDYHINADEPGVLDYNTNFKSPAQVASLYAPDQFRVSDHDPVLVGLKLRCGDLNNDSRVDGLDFTLFLQALGTVNVRADYNRDGRVTLRDYRYWLACLLNAQHP